MRRPGHRFIALLEVTVKFSPRIGNGLIVGANGCPRNHLDFYQPASYIASHMGWVSQWWVMLSSPRTACKCDACPAGLDEFEWLFEELRSPGIINPDPGFHERVCERITAIAGQSVWAPFVYSSTSTRDSGLLSLHVSRRTYLPLHVEREWRKLGFEQLPFCGC